MKSLNQIIAELETFANVHYQIHTFGHGDVWEVAPNSSEIVYPVLWFVPQGATTGLREVTNNFTVLCMDLVRSGEENETEVLSDTLQIILDVVSYYRQQHDQNYIVEFGSTIQPFTERDPDMLAGHSITVSIRQPFNYSECAIPFSGAPAPITPTCSPATIQNAASNPTYQASIASGDNLVLPQVKVLDSDGVTEILANYIPESNGYVATCSTSCDPVTEQVNGVTIGTIPSGDTNNQVIENTIGTPVGTAANPSVVPDATVQLNGTTVGTIASGATDSFAVNLDGSPSGSWDGTAWQVTSVPCADATIELNGVEMTTIPSGDTENITVLQSSGATQVGSKQGTHWRIDDSPIQSSGGLFTDSVMAEETYTIADVNWTDSDGSPQTSEYSSAIVCTPSVSSSITLGAYSDAGFTTPITEADVNNTIYLRAVPSGFTPTEYLFFYEDVDGLLYPIYDGANDNSSWTVIGATGIGRLLVSATDDGVNYTGTELTFEVTAQDRLLDAYPDIMLCNSLINRRNLFTTAVARVRRSSDNDVADFTPTSALEPPRIDDDSIASNASPGSHNGDTLSVFSAATNGFATTMYNQCASGGVSLVQSVLVSQPQLTSSGTIYEFGGLPSLLFNGNNLYSAWNNTTAPSAFQTLSGAISVVFRFNALAVSGAGSFYYSNYTIVELRQNVATVQKVPFNIGISNGKISVGVANALATYDVFTSTATISTSVNYSVGVSINGNTIKIYINGVLDSTHTIVNATASRAIGTTNSTLSIGVRSRDGGQIDSSLYNGYLIGDMPLIAPVVYSDAQFLDIHNTYQT